MPEAAYIKGTAVAEELKVALAEDLMDPIEHLLGFPFQSGAMMVISLQDPTMVCSSSADPEAEPDPVSEPAVVVAAALDVPPLEDLSSAPKRAKATSPQPPMVNEQREDEQMRRKARMAMMTMVVLLSPVPLL